MKKLFENNRNLEIFKGVIGLVLGILILANPQTALMAMATYVGLLALIAGAALIIWALTKKKGSWQWRLSQGVINALLGLLIISYPDVTASLLIFLMGLWITFIGIFQLTATLKLREKIPGQHLSLTSGILSILVGALLMFNPFEGAVLATIILGAYALFYGLVRFYTAWKMG